MRSSGLGLWTLLCLRRRATTTSPSTFLTWRGRFMGTYNCSFSSSSFSECSVARISVTRTSQRARLSNITSLSKINYKNYCSNSQFIKIFVKHKIYKRKLEKYFKVYFFYNLFSSIDISKMFHFVYIISISSNG